ncbi:MAG: radical SAM protein [Bauldia sp.]|nr:radical SAM protein [Bauldia sp.]
MFQPKFPLHMVFILGNYCNLSCIHCSSNANRGGSMGYTTDQAKNIIDQMADVGVLDVALSGGEPLLRRDLPNLVAYACARGITVGTSTNGYPLTDKAAVKLKEAGLARLQISIDGTEKTHDIVRGRGSFAKAVQAVKRSVAHGLRTHICFTAMRMNARLLPDVLKLARELGVDGFNLSQFVPTGRGAQDQGLGPEAARWILENWLEAKNQYPEIHFTAHSSGLAALRPGAGDCRGGCQAGISIGSITADGDVTPCVMFPLSLGNLNRMTLREIWASSKLVDVLHRRNVSGACGKCDFKWQCGGCRAAAWAVHGDILAEDPYCWLIDANLALTNKEADQPCRTSSSIARD